MRYEPTTIHISKEIIDEVMGNGDSISIATLMGIGRETFVPTCKGDVEKIGITNDGLSFVLEVGVSFCLFGNDTKINLETYGENREQINSSLKWYITTPTGYEPYTPAPNAWIRHIEKVYSYIPRDIAGDEAYVYLDTTMHRRYMQIKPDGNEIKNKAVFELLDGNIPVIKVTCGTVLLVTGVNVAHAICYNEGGFSKLPLEYYKNSVSTKVKVPDVIPERVYGEFVPFHFKYNFVSLIMSRICALFNSREEANENVVIKSPYLRKGHTYEPVIKLHEGMDVEIRVGTLFRTTSKYDTYAVTNDGLVQVFAVVEEWPVECIMGVVDGVPTYIKNTYSSSRHDFPEGTRLFAIVPKDRMVLHGPDYDKETKELRMAVGNVVYVREPTSEYVIIEMDCNRTSFSPEPYFKYGNFDLISL